VYYTWLESVDRHVGQHPTNDSHKAKQKIMRGYSGVTYAFGERVLSGVVVVFDAPPSAVVLGATAAAGDELGADEELKVDVRGGAAGFCWLALGLTLCSTAKGGSGAIVGGMATVVIAAGRQRSSERRPTGASPTRRGVVSAFYHRISRRRTAARDIFSRSSAVAQTRRSWPATAACLLARGWGGGGRFSKRETVAPPNELLAVLAARAATTRFLGGRGVSARVGEGLACGRDVDPVAAALAAVVAPGAHGEMEERDGGRREEGNDRERRGG
jgi:hypothetical protein